VNTSNCRSVPSPTSLLSRYTPPLPLLIFWWHLLICNPDKVHTSLDSSVIRNCGPIRNASTVQIDDPKVGIIAMIPLVIGEQQQKHVLLKARTFAHPPSNVAACKGMLDCIYLHQSIEYSVLWVATNLTNVHQTQHILGWSSHGLSKVQLCPMGCHCKKSSCQPTQ